MATFDTDFLDKFKEIVASSSSIDELKDRLGQLSGGMEFFAKVVRGAGFEVQEFRAKIQELTKVKAEEFLKSLGPAADKAQKRFKDLGLSAGSLVPILIGMTGKGQALSKTFGTFNELGYNASGATTQITKLSSNLEKMGMLPGPLKTLAGYAALGDAARNMENQMLRNQAASGTLNVELGTLQKNLQGLSTRTMEYSRLTSEIGTATGLTADVVGKYGNQLMSATDLMDKNVKVGKNSTHQMHMLEAAIKVARGTHQDYGEVIEDVTKFHVDFGATGQQALDTIARMHSATQSLGLRMQDVRTYVKDAGESFKYFGDNTSGSLSVLAKFGGALKESGLGARATVQLVSQFTKGIGQMDTAQRAFLSGQAGGPGGLLGALKIEESLAKGKKGLSEITDMIQQTMKRQFGGRIITREEAVRGGEGAARQFEMQRQMLMSGPFGQLASSPEAAAKLIEAMAKGKTGDVADILKKGDKALEGAITDGAAIAKNQSNILIEQNNKLAHLGNLNSKMADELAKQTIGIQGIFGEALDSAKGMRTASQRAANREVRVVSKKLSGGDHIKETKRLAGTGFDEAKKLMEGAVAKVTGQDKKPTRPAPGQQPAGPTVPRRRVPEPTPPTPPRQQRRRTPAVPAPAPPPSPGATVAPAVQAQPKQAAAPGAAPGAGKVPAGGEIGTITVKVQDGKIRDLIKEELASFRKDIVLKESQHPYTGTK